MSDLPVAIVLSSGINGLGAVRSLAERGVPVIVVAESGRDIALRSRYPRARHVITHNRTDAGVQELRELLAGLGLDRAIVIPTSDWFVSALRSEAMRLPDGFLAVAPDADLVEMLVDKAVETARVGKVLPIPPTVTPLPATPEELLARLRLPIIVKPRSFAHMCIGGKNVVLRSTEEARAFYARFPEVRERVVAQEVIEGPDRNLWVCHAAFDERSRMASAFTFRRLRLSPSHYGVTSYAVSERNEDVIELVRRLGDALHYVGPAMVEFKWDPRDSTYRYIELNPRLGLANYFDGRCGPGTAYVAYRLAAGLSVGDVGVQRDGAVFVSLYEDLYSRRHDGETLGAIAADYLGDFGRQHVFAYWSLRDPLPALTMAYRQAGALLGAFGRRLQGARR